VWVIGTQISISPTEAAFIDGTRSHALDFDDSWDYWNVDVLPGHPSVVPVSTILALRERSAVSGTEAIVAYVAALETIRVLSGPINPGHYRHSWHSTATMGTFVAVATAAKILGLNRSEIATALNVAASMPAGLKRNFGTMTKPIHVGQAARSGLTAAFLAREGFDANGDAIAGDGGFFDLYSGDDGPDDGSVSVPGETWQLLEDGIDVKKYPCCSLAQSGTAAAIELASTHEVDLDSIYRIRVLASRGAREILRYDSPETGTEAKFSMHYPIAYGIVHGDVGLEAFDERGIDDPAVAAVQNGITFDVDESLSYASHRATVQIETDDGRQLEKTRENPPGFGNNRLTLAQLRDKFSMCATTVLTTQEADRVFSTLNDLDSVENLQPVVTSLNGS